MHSLYAVRDRVRHQLPHVLIRRVAMCICTEVLAGLCEHVGAGEARLEQTGRPAAAAAAAAVAAGAMPTHDTPCQHNTPHNSEPAALATRSTDTYLATMPHLGGGL